MVRDLARFLYPFGAKRSVLRGPASGMHFIVEPGIGATYALGFDTATPRHFVKRIRPGMTVYDVGANKGQSALLFAALVGSGGRVVALEPAPAEFSSLARNIELNLLDNVKIFQLAALDSAGNHTFVYVAEQPTQGKLQHVEQSYEVDGTQFIQIQSVRLDTMLEINRPPDFIKIDVEGAAASVLRGAVRILEEFCPIIYVELHGPEEQLGIKDELLSRGYLVETLDGSLVRDPTTSWYSPLYCYKPLF